MSHLSHFYGNARRHAALICLLMLSGLIPATDNKIRKSKIEIVNPELRKQGLQLSYQQGCYAKSR
jgi:hypothetical protein